MSGLTLGDKRVFVLKSVLLVVQFIVFLLRFGEWVFTVWNDIFDGASIIEMAQKFFKKISGIKLLKKKIQKKIQRKDYTKNIRKRNFNAILREIPEKKIKEIYISFGLTSIKIKFFLINRFFADRN